MDGSRNNKRYFFQILVTKRCIAQMLRDSLMQPCVNQSELSKRSRKSLRLRLLCIILMLRHWQMCFQLFSVWDFQLKDGNTENIYCNRGPPHATLLITTVLSDALNHCVGVPTMVREYWERSENSLMFTMTGISSINYACILKLRIAYTGSSSE